MCCFILIGQPDKTNCCTDISGNKHFVRFVLTCLSCLLYKGKAGKIQLRVLSAEQEVILYRFAVALLWKTMTIRFSVCRMTKNITFSVHSSVYVEYTSFMWWLHKVRATSAKSQRSHLDPRLHSMYFYILFWPNLMATNHLTLG